MTDDLKERLLDNAKWGDGEAEEALNRITDLEARLAAAEADRDKAREYAAQARIRENKAEDARVSAEVRALRAEAGEDALAKAGSEARIALAGMVRPYNAVNLLDAALAAYEARRQK